MYSISGNGPEKIKPITFSDLGLKENDIEEILRINIDMLCDEEESMLIVGQQVKNIKQGRSDLIAIDNNGSLVLIEIKRDIRDIISRSEAFEFQAIRYAASYATIESPDELVNKVYAPYIEKHRDEFELKELTSYEFATRKLNEFLEDNDAEKSFNNKQKIILAASDFDEQTLSAVAWLNSNNVDISCYSLIPYKLNEQLYLYIEKILPPTTYEDYYVDLIDTKTSSTQKKKGISRRALPRIDEMLEWGVVKEGDIVFAKGRNDKGTLLANGNIIVDGNEKSLQVWLKEVYGWSSVGTYSMTIHEKSGKHYHKSVKNTWNRENRFSWVA